VDILCGHRLIEAEDDMIHTIIIDECHHILASQDYRPTLTLLHDLKRYGIQRVFLTGTMPPTLVNTFMRHAGLQENSHHTICMPTQRPELGWALLEKHVRKRPSYKELKMLVDKMTEVLFKDGYDRGIVFVQNKADCDNLGTAYNWVSYHADIQDKSKADQSWRNGTGASRWIVATSSFMNGVDYAHVRVAIFFQPCDGQMDLVQGGGRCGRSGQPSYVLVCQGDGLVEPPTVEEDDFKQIKMMNTWLSNTSQCRRLHISLAMDGVPTCCGDRQGDVFCDICKPTDPIYMLARQALSIGTPGHLVSG
jgi:superfamily II DNA helicase RecQ